MRRNSELLLLALFWISYGGQLQSQDSPPLSLPQLHTTQVCAGGDVTLGTNLDTMWTASAFARYGVRLPAYPPADSLLLPLRKVIIGADMLLLNIEGAIGNANYVASKCRTGSTNCFAFRQPIETATALQRLGGSTRVIGNVANNHSRDAGDDGIQATVDWLTKAAVAVTGYDTLATPVSSVWGDTVAFLGFHTSRETPDARDLVAVRRHVRRAAARWSRLVVTAHIGAEGIRAQRTRNRSEPFLGMDRGNPVAFAHTAIAAGADLVVAHGPHVLRAAEWWGAGLVFYSLGNLLNYGPFRLTEPMNRGAVVCASLDYDGRVTEARLFSTHQLLPGIIEIDNTKRAATLIDSLSHLDFPATGVTVDTSGVLGRIGTKKRMKFFPIHPSSDKFD
jgi:hypothetical protein